jgi:Trk K+ transport system NAD-binding subunit
MHPTEARTTSAPVSKLILVCGLGDVGQHCVSLLHDSGLEVVGIDHSSQALKLAEHLADKLQRLVIGDIRQVKILEEAGLALARAILLLTGDEDVNLQAALIILAIAPEMRIVLRSRRERLRQLIQKQFPNLVMLDPTILVSQIIALSLLDAQLLGSFVYQEYSFEVRLRAVIQPTPLPTSVQEGRASGERRAIGFWRSQQLGADAELIASLANPLTLDRGELICEVLGFEAQQEARFFRWSATRPRQIPLLRPKRLLTQAQTMLLRTFEQYTNRIVLGLLLIMLALLLATQLAFGSWLPNLPPFDRLIYAIVLLLGNFGDLLEPLKNQYGSPPGLLLLSIALTIAGTALVGVFYALFADALISRRLPFNQAKRRPPRRPNFLIWGQDELAVEVFHRLKTLRQNPVLVADFTASSALPDLPLIAEQRLLKERLDLGSSLRGLATLKEDELKNLEAALEVREHWPQLRCTLATHKTYLHERIQSLLPDIRVINVAHLAASTLTSAALGEHVISAIQVQSLTLLVMVYNLTAQPNLGGLQVSDLIWGFLTIPLLYSCPDQATILLPRNEIRLNPLGRVLVLTSQEGIQRVEQNRPIQPCWQLWVECQPHADAAFEGMRALVQETDCPLKLASSYLKCDRPGPFPQLLYLGPAQRLNQRLQRLGIRSHLERLNSGLQAESIGSVQPP